MRYEPATSLNKGVKSKHGYNGIAARLVTKDSLLRKPIGHVAHS